MSYCGENDHRFYVPDVVLIPAEGKVVVPAICTACGTAVWSEKIVAKPHTPLDSLKMQNNKKKE